MIYSLKVNVGAGNRILARLFGLAAVVGLVSAICLYFWSPDGESGAIVDDPNCILNDVVPNRNYDVDFHIRNPTGQVLRVVGTEFT